MTVLHYDKAEFKDAAMAILADGECDITKAYYATNPTTASAGDLEPLIWQAIEAWLFQRAPDGINITLRSVSGVPIPLSETVAAEIFKGGHAEISDGQKEIHAPLTDASQLMIRFRDQ